MKVLILTDARKSGMREDEVDTLAQVKAVKKALQLLGHTVMVEAFSLNLILTARRIEKSGCDFVFNLVENLSSSRLLHLVPLLCQSLSIPCSGGGAYTLSITGDKVVAKRQLDLAGLPTPPWLEDGCDGSRFLGVPVMVKPIAQEASVGIGDASVRTFTDTDELTAYLREHPDYFAERYIDGREFNLSVLPGGRVLPVCEMCFVDYPADKVKIVGYEAKWQEQSFAYQHTQRSYTFGREEQGLIEELKRLAQAVYVLFGNSGYARVDVRVDQQNKPFILEMNSNPCIAADSGFIAAALQAGMTYCEVIEHLLRR
ncbi:MAG: D-alanine--D-alanine ligase [Spirochaetales bacterium]|nr:D-alanine--D-alanine ligase [Spirochaetales bacterium]